MIVMNSVPRRDTSQRGMLCMKLTSSMAVTISSGRDAASVTAVPMPCMAAETALPQMEKMAVIISMPFPTATLAAAKRMKWRRTNSGR